MARRQRPSPKGRKKGLTRWREGRRDRRAAAGRYTRPAPQDPLTAMEVPSVSQPAVRTVEIAPPSARAETWNVLRAAALIVLATWIYIADTAAPAGTGAE